jgi:hypothetical protein
MSRTKVIPLRPVLQQVGFSTGEEAAGGRGGGMSSPGGGAGRPPSRKAVNEEAMRSAVRA